MSKERRTVSLDAETDEYLSRAGVNASELVNELVRREMEGGADERSLLKFRIRRIEDEIDELESRLEDRRELKERLTSRLESRKEEKRKDERETWQQAMDVLTFDEFAGNVSIRSGDVAVDGFAHELGMDSDEFREEAIRRYEEGDDA